MHISLFRDTELTIIYLHVFKFNVYKLFNVYKYINTFVSTFKVTYFLIDERLFFRLKSIVKKYFFKFFKKYFLCKTDNTSIFNSAMCKIYSFKEIFSAFKMT